MLLFPNAKINVGLHILRKREDGFHDIETCMYPIPWHDALEITLSDTFSFRSTGLPIDGDDTKNLVVKAYRLLQEDFDLAPVKIHLHKVIPMGAGLGGGSSDAAYALKMLNFLLGLKLSPQRLKEYAAMLGSDCAFFIDNVPAICTGRGEIMQPIDFTLSGLKLVLVKPDVHVSTAEAYAGVIPHENRIDLKELILTPQNLQQQLVNDFEMSVFQQHPELAEVKQKMIDYGAVYAAMSGSGATVFGLFEEVPTPLVFARHVHKILDL